MFTILLHDMPGRDMAYLLNMVSAVSRNPSNALQVDIAAAGSWSSRL